MMKVSELEGAQLDWAVAKALGMTGMFCLEEGKPICCVEESDFDGIDDWVGDGWAFTPSVYWGVGGPIIERNDHLLPYCTPGHRLHMGAYSAQTPGGFEYSGPTPLIAAMRALVASKLGPEIELPA